MSASPAPRWWSTRRSLTRLEWRLRPGRRRRGQPGSSRTGLVAAVRPLGSGGRDPGSTGGRGPAGDHRRGRRRAGSVRRRRVPVTAAGGRSGVCANAVPVFGGIALDMTGLSGIVAVDSESLLVDVRAGPSATGWSRLRLRHGLTLGHWPQSIAISTVGGWLACRSAGPILDPVREDRGHGGRTRGGPSRWSGDPHRGQRPAGCHRSRS